MRIVQPIQKATVICVYDGKIFGLTDMLRGFVSTYKICKQFNLKFKIHIEQPFKLADFLQPNICDWKISPKEFEAAEKENNFLEIQSYNNPTANDVWAQISQRSTNKNYLIILTNINAAMGNEYCELFNELFKPTAELQEAIDLHLRQIGGDFVSATLRFQQLLGDFVEENFPVLEQPKRELLMAQCLKHLEEIHNENPEKKILVTSDSFSFLAAAQKIDYTYVVLEKIIHPINPQAKNADKKVWTKTFLDLFLLKNSKKIYSIVDGLMYSSTFPLYASSLGNVPFELKDYNQKTLVAAGVQLHKKMYIDGYFADDEKENLTRQALSGLRATFWLCFKNSGLDIYEKLQDEESRTIFKELFYHNYLTSNNWFYNYRAHYCNILQTTLQSRLAEKSKNFGDFSVYDNNFFLGYQYFDSVVTLSEDEVFVDVGAYNGDTVKDFLKFSKGKYRHIYAFEPMANNYQILNANIKKWNIEKITTVPKGLHVSDTTLRFDGGGAGFAACDSGAIEVPVVSLDKFLDKDEKVTFIKMDVEGSELNALRGAANTIRRYKPKLAISIYHKKEDIIEIPACILELVPEYKLYVRHYTYSTDDTVLYAIAE